MGNLIREKDWAKTELGPVESWSQALLTVSSLMMASTFPMSLWWGPNSIVLYNDGYLPLTGDKHPTLLGSRARDSWGEIWDILAPALDSVMRGGQSTYSEDQCLMMYRHGFVEVLSLLVGNDPDARKHILRGDTFPFERRLGMLA